MSRGPLALRGVKGQGPFPPEASAPAGALSTRLSRIRKDSPKQLAHLRRKGNTPRHNAAGKSVMPGGELPQSPRKRGASSPGGGAFWQQQAWRLLRWLFAVVVPRSPTRRTSRAIPYIRKRRSLLRLIQLNQGQNFAAMAAITGPRKKQLSTVKMPTCPPSRKPMTVTRMSYPMRTQAKGIFVRREMICGTAS